VTRLANGEESESLGADSYGGSREQETEAKRKLETGARNLRRWKPDQIKSGLQQDPRRANLRCGKNETLHQGGRTKNRPRRNRRRSAAACPRAGESSGADENGRPAPHGEKQIAMATRETRNKSGGRRGNKVGSETETPQAATEPGHREQKS
jgi:hypothetical protein